MQDQTARLGLWIPEHLHSRMKALANARSKTGPCRVELRQLYAEALSRLADALDGSADLEL